MVQILITIAALIIILKNFEFLIEMVAAIVGLFFKNIGNLVFLSGCAYFVIQIIK